MPRVNGRFAPKGATVETTETQPQPTVGIETLRDIVAAGMSVSDARALLAENFSPEAVLELAVLQSQQRLTAAADAQTATAKAMQKAMRPENETHPGVSAFSYPEGDRAKPKPALPFAFSYNGYPVSKFPETQHWRELELMAQVTPGTYTVLRKDGSVMTVEVSAEKDANGAITALDLHFPVSRDDKPLVPPQMVVLYQIVKPGSPRQTFVESMQEWLHHTIWQPEADSVPA